MATANIIITGAKITPNPVEVKKTFIISVEIEDRWFGLAGTNGRMIATGDGAVIATKQ